MKRLIIRPACAGATPSAAPMAVSAGRLMSMPKDGRATRKLNSKVKAMEAGGTRTRRTSLDCAIELHGTSIRGNPPVISAAAANVELAINRGVLLTDTLEIAGVLRWNVARVGLAVADRRAPGQGCVLRRE